MSQRKMWKMIHLIHLYGQPSLSHAALLGAGIDCHPDTIQPLLSSSVIEARPPHEYTLSNAAQKLLEVCVVANKRTMARM